MRDVSSSAVQTLEYIEEALPQETPTAFGLHPNAGIGFRLREAEGFLDLLGRLQPRSAGGGGDSGIEDRAKAVRQPLTCWVIITMCYASDSCHALPLSGQAMGFSIRSKTLLCKWGFGLVTWITLSCGGGF